jgi:hypothetical protein
MQQSNRGKTAGWIVLLMSMPYEQVLVVLIGVAIYIADNNILTVKG